MGTLVVSDDEFALAVLNSGLVADSALEATRRDVAQIRASGRPVSLAHLLVKRKHITLDQRKKLELRLRIAREPLPKRIGSYRPVQKLGEGGMGSVYLVEDQNGQRVALKTLNKELAKDPEGRARFAREARAASELQHPNIVRALEVGEDAGQPFYAMEFCDGLTVEEILDRDDKMPLELSLKVITQVADGLAYAHARGIVHRDIKPGNIFLLQSGQVKILDLGLSKNYKTKQSFNTMEGTALGTPNYLSPEQALGMTDLDGRTDQYALAATLYHMLTGIAPFDAPNTTTTMMGHVGEQLADVREKCPEVQSGLLDVMTRMLAKDPADRYADMIRVLEELDRARKGQALETETLDPSLSSLGRKNPSAVSELSAQSDAANTPEPVPLKEEGQSTIAIWLVVLVGAALLAAITAVLVWGISG